MNELYAVYFQPEDWLAFRENRRFNPGDTVKSVFPSPFPFYGAVRTALLKKYGVKLNYHQKVDLSRDLIEKIGDENDPGMIRLFGPFLYSEQHGEKKHYFPAPKNVYKHGSVYKIMRYFDTEVELDDLKLGLAWIPEYDNVQEAEEKYIEARELIKLQSGESFVLCNPENFEIESKLGVALEKSQKKAQEGMIYTMAFYRFKDGGFFMLTDSQKTVEELSKIDGVFLGSKQRWCSLKIESFSHNIFKRIESKEIAIELITPAIYDNGIVPKEGRFGEVKIKAIAAGKKIAISGWDYASGKPKPICQAVSPGTVYYLEKIPEDDENIIKQSFYNQFGFGRFVYIPFKS